MTRAVPDRLWCHATLRDGGGPAQTSTYDLALYAPDGAEVGRVEGFVVKRAPREALLRGLRAADRLLYQVRWLERPPLVTPAGGSRLVCGAAPRNSGDGSRTSAWPCTRRPTPPRRSPRSPGRPPPSGVVWLAEGGAAGDEAVRTADRALIAPLLDLARALADRGIALPDGLTVVTRRGVAAEPGDAVDPLHSALWGLVRSLALERPSSTAACSTSTPPPGRRPRPSPPASPRPPCATAGCWSRD